MNRSAIQAQIFNLPQVYWRLCKRLIGVTKREVDGFQFLRRLQQIIQAVVPIHVERLKIGKE